MVKDEPGELARLFVAAGDLDVNLKTFASNNVLGRPSGLVDLFVQPAVRDALVEGLSGLGSTSEREGVSGRVRLPVVTPALVIAIDGPAGSGKSSVSREVASRLGLAYLDTGGDVPRRHLGRPGQRIDPDDTDAVAALMAGEAAPAIESGTDPAEPFIRVDGVDVAEAIRGELVTSAVSAVSAVATVRQGMVDLQREHAHASSGIVVEGRDIGSVVLPQADIKVFLTADSSVRAQRRAAEVNEDDPDRCRRPKTHSRPGRERHHASHFSLAPAEGSIEIDTTNLTFDDVVDAVISWCGTHQKAGERCLLLSPRMPATWWVLCSDRLTGSPRSTSMRSHRADRVLIL